VQETTLVACAFPGLAYTKREEAVRREHLPSSSGRAQPVLAYRRRGALCNHTTSDRRGKGRPGQEAREFLRRLTGHRAGSPPRTSRSRRGEAGIAEQTLKNPDDTAGLAIPWRAKPGGRGPPPYRGRLAGGELPFLIGGGVVASQPPGQWTNYLLERRLAHLRRGKGSGERGSQRTEEGGRALEDGQPGGAAGGLTYGARAG
jgi:hypothetical protein